MDVRRRFRSRTARSTTRRPVFSAAQSRRDQPRARASARGRNGRGECRLPVPRSVCSPSAVQVQRIERCHFIAETLEHCPSTPTPDTSHNRHSYPMPSNRASPQTPRTRPLTDAATAHRIPTAGIPAFALPAASTAVTWFAAGARTAAPDLVPVDNRRVGALIDLQVTERTRYGEWSGFLSHEERLP